MGNYLFIHYIILRVACGLLFLKGGLCTIMETEKDVVEYIFRDYNPYVRPVKNFGKPINISISTDLMKVESLNEQAQVFQSTLAVNVEWTDEYLNWDTKQTKGITSVSVPVQMMWFPHFTITNSASDDISGEMSLMPYTAFITSSGKVSVSFVARLQTSCTVNLGKFPFDNQTCTIEITTKAVNIYHKLIISRLPLMEGHTFLEKNSEWGDIEFDQTLKFTNLTKYELESVLITVKLKRNPTFYVLYLIIPAVLMAFVSLLVFLLPPESGERIGLSVTVLLSYSFFMLMVSDICPRDGENISIIVIYIIMMEAVSVINLTVTVISLRYHHGVAAMFTYPTSKCLCRGKGRGAPDGINKVVPFKEEKMGVDNDQYFRRVKDSDIAMRCDFIWFIVTLSIVAVTSLAALFTMTS